MSGFEAAVRQHQRKVFTFARYYLGNSEEAEDVTQEVLFKLWQRRQQIDEEGRQAWLLKVTRNACFDRLRKRQTAAKIFAEDTEEDATKRVPISDPDPESQMAATDFRQHLKQALGQLTDPMKSILILREIEGFKYQEIADVLDVPLATVRVYLHRGRRRLREQLREVYGRSNTL